MPRVGFVGVPVNDDDRTKAQELLSAASDYADKVSRELRQLDQFVAANRFPEGTPTHEVFALYGAQWLNSGRSANTLKAILEDFKTFRVSPFDIAAARARVEQQRLKSGVDRVAAQGGRIFIRKIAKHGLPGVLRTRPLMAVERERQAFWSLVCVTGNRPDNVLRALRVDVLPDHIHVQWGGRKVHSNVGADYRFEWSATPPEWVLERWRQLGRTTWAFPPGCAIAASINGWLEKWGLEGLTSSSPRERLDQSVRPLVLTGRMAPEVYERVLDHKLATSLDHYASGILVDV